MSACQSSQFQTSMNNPSLPISRVNQPSDRFCEGNYLAERKEYVLSHSNISFNVPKSQRLSQIYRNSQSGSQSQTRTNANVRNYGSNGPVEFISARYGITIPYNAAQSMYCASIVRYIPSNIPVTMSPTPGSQPPPNPEQPGNLPIETTTSTSTTSIMPEYIQTQNLPQI